MAEGLLHQVIVSALRNMSKQFVYLGVFYLTFNNSAVLAAASLYSSMYTSSSPNWGGGGNGCYGCYDLEWSL